jgi:RNA polymerase sigma factor (sigma-70 family)
VTDPLRPDLDAALAGDRVALDRICRALQGPLFRLALRVLGSPEDAADATQEVLVQVVTHLAQFRGESRVLTWAYAVATRHLLRCKARNERTLTVEAVADRIDRGLAATEPSSEPEGDVHVQERETRLACTQGMLFALSREERVAIVLAEVLGADDDLGARLCEVAPGTFRQRLSRARGKLRPLLEARCGLATEASPCRCRRQARARQLEGPVALRWTNLPAEEGARLDRAAAQLGALRALGPVLALDREVAAPEDVWRSVQVRLPDVLGG